METHNGATRISMGNTSSWGYRGKLEYSKCQMLPTAETGEADLYRQLFIYLEQLEDPVRLIDCSRTRLSELHTGIS